MRPELLRMTRDHLVHVLPRLNVSGPYSMIAEMPKALTQYHHTVVHNTPLERLDIDAVMNMQAQGVEVLHTDDRITADCIERLKPTGVIIYGAYATQVEPEVGLVVPTMYYVYGDYDAAIWAPDIVVPCSSYAAKWNRHGNPLYLKDDITIAPLVDTRGLRQLAGAPGNFTVGIITSGAHRKYPFGLVRMALERLPGDIALVISKPPKDDPYWWPHISDAAKIRSGVQFCRIYPQAPLLYTVHADVLLYGTGGSYLEPYGRTVVEAMALGKVVVCERRGIFRHVLEDKVNALLFDTNDEAIELIKWIQHDTQARNQIGANAQMWAARQDVSIHALTLKRTLKMIGA